MPKKVSIFLTQDFRKNRDEIRELISLMMDDYKIGDYEITVKAVGDDEMSDLNQRFKGVIGSTDVLTFSLEEDPLEGEIYISLNQASLSASKEGTSIETELFNLVVHGTLHLLGLHHNSEEELYDNKKLMKKYGK